MTECIYAKPMVNIRAHESAQSFLKKKKERNTDRQTDRQIERQTDRQT